MANWRDHILTHFERGISRLTLVADPDGLLTEEGMLAAVKERGFDLIPFDDPVAFRYAYEAQYRSLWDQGDQTDLVVVLRSAEQRLQALPYDLLKAGRHLSFALHQLFPKLSYPVISALDRRYLDALHDAYQQYDGAALGERATREFVLTHCFKVVPGLITTPVDLLKMLLSRHYAKVTPPPSLDAHLLEHFAREGQFIDWPLTEILPSREQFLRFLQQQWVEFLNPPDGGPLFSACKVPFGHEDIRAYIDTYFLEGLLTPVQQERIEHLPAWVRTGIVHDPQADALRRFRRLHERFGQGLPGEDASHKDWQQAAQSWAELIVLRWELDQALDGQDRTSWTATQQRVEGAFEAWMLKRYGSLHNLPFTQQPVMVHQVPRFLALERNRRKLSRLALVVVDGLALDQWLLVRRGLERQYPAWKYEEAGVFAWVPTLTSVSRQSIFAGEPPLYFPESLHTTAKEKGHWVRFWEDQGVQRASVELLVGVESGASQGLESTLGNPRLAILGLVMNTVDDTMHGVTLGMAGMHNQVRLWSSQGHLASVLSALVGRGFAVYLTADHGNAGAEGMGQPQEGVLVEARGKRARVYEQPAFRQEVRAAFPDTVEWPGPGLPSGKYALLAGQGKAFATRGDLVVAHGGIALEEVIVPFVRVET